MSAMFSGLWSSSARKERAAPPLFDGEVRNVAGTTAAVEDLRSVCSGERVVVIT